MAKKKTEEVQAEVVGSDDLNKKSEVKQAARPSKPWLEEIVSRIKKQEKK